ncbi:hypothetical protein ACEWY4_003319 [Coilia grayii]|uniref:Fibrinogen C-terminal domain-containing protein n=1 Tax=Coilia grayii TaxID=363190 RepID=A0ABD1KQY6_9TELE
MDWGTDLWGLPFPFLKAVSQPGMIYRGSGNLPTDNTAGGQRFSNHQSFLDILNEMNDYAGQRELIAENMMMNICIELTKYLQELKQERKSSKKRFEREWREAEKAAQYAEKTDLDINATKADVEKAKQQAHMRSHVAEECKNNYAAQLQKYNKEQGQFYFTDMPLIFNRLQDMDKRRVKKLAQGYVLFSDTEKHVMPIIGKCLDGITRAGNNVNERNDSLALIEQHKSGFERPGDLEFEDYSQGINRTSSESSLGTPKGPLDLLGKNKSKPFWLFSKKSKVGPHSRPWRDCQHVLESGETTSGIYLLRPQGTNRLMQAWCEQSRAQGGWTVIQSRQDGSVNFFRTWEQYKQGFGNLDGEYWLGLEHLYWLTAQVQYRLRVFMEDWQGRQVYAEYDSFRLEPETDWYRLRLGNYNGNAGDSLSWHNNKAFTTLDRDKDAYSGNCAHYQKGGWWYHMCAHSNLNGVWYRGGHYRSRYQDGVYWAEFHGGSYSLKRVAMMIKPS